MSTTTIKRLDKLADAADRDVAVQATPAATPERLNAIREYVSRVAPALAAHFTGWVRWLRLSNGLPA